MFGGFVNECGSTPPKTREQDDALVGTCALGFRVRAERSTRSSRAKIRARLR